MIHAIVARIGGGKSHNAVGKKVIPALLSGRDVFINFEVKPGLFRYVYSKWRFGKDVGNLYYYYSFDQLRYVRSGVIILDEAQDYIDAQNFQNLPPWFRVLLSQNRKIKEYSGDGIGKPTDIYAVTQDFFRLDINFRRYCYDVLFIHNIVGRFGWSCSYDYSENARTSKEKFMMKWFTLRCNWLSLWVFDCYYSNRMIKSVQDKSEYEEKPYEKVFDTCFDLRSLFSDPSQQAALKSLLSDKRSDEMSSEEAVRPADDDDSRGL